MKVLIVTPTFYSCPPPMYGGTEQVCYLLAEELNKMGHKVSVAAPIGSRFSEGVEHIPTVQPIFGQMQEDQAWPGVQAHIIDPATNRPTGKFDLVHEHSFRMYSYNIAKDWPEVKVCATVHWQMHWPSVGAGPPPVPKPNLIALSRAHAMACSAALGIHFEHVHNGIAVEAFPFQKEKSDRFLFLGRIARFKGCLSPGQMVNTWPLPKPIESVLVGDRVLGHDGQLHYVREIMYRPYSGDLLKVLCGKYGIPILLTPEHPIHVLRLKGTAGTFRPSYLRKWRPASKKMPGKPEWVSAKDLKGGDMALAPALSIPCRKAEIKVDQVGKAWNGNAWFVPNHKKIPERIEITDELARFFGLYIAEGSASGRRVSFALHRKEADYADFLEKVLSEKFGVYGIRKVEENKMEVVANSVSLEKSFSQYFGRGAKNKRIPPQLMGHAAPLLRGIWEGDGCITNGSGHEFFSFGTASRALAEQMWGLLVGFGIVPSYGSHYQAGGQYWHMMLKGKNAEMFSALTSLPIRKSQRHKHSWEERWDRQIWLPVRKVERINYRGPVYNLDVDGCHSYSAGIALHNCHEAIRLADKHRFPLDVAGEDRFVGDPQYVHQVMNACRGMARYHGEVPQERKLELLRNARAVVLPYMWAEPFGIVPIEANACGTAAIGLDYPGSAMREIIQDGVNGFLCKSVEEIGEATRNVGDIKPEECRRVVEERFTARLQAERYVKLYEQVLDGRGW